MGLFSQDRPRIPGDPPHLEIMTKIGHALPDKARRVLAASAMIGKGKFKGAKQVMTRKQPVPKLEEGLMKTIKDKVSATAKKLNTGKPYRNYDGNDPHEMAPKEHIKEGIVRQIKRAFTKDSIKAKLEKKLDKESNAKNADLSKLSKNDWKKKDLERTKKIDRLVSLGKRSSALKKDGTGNMFMPSWPKKPGDLKYMSKKKLDEGRTAGEDIDTRISRNAERADHHTNEYLGNPRGIQSAEHASKADRHTAVYQRLKQFKKTGKIHENAIDEGIVKKISRAFNKATGIQRAGLQHALTKQYKEAGKRSDDYHEIYRDYESDYEKSGKKSDKKSMEYYKGRRDSRNNRQDDLYKRAEKVANAGKLEEAVSRKLIAKKNATKQRVKYVQRKGELPPIMEPKNRHKFTRKELDKLTGILGKQKTQRKDAKATALEVKKGVLRKAEEPVQPSRGTSVSVFAKTPLPGEHDHNAQPHIAVPPMNDPVRAHQKPEGKKTSSTADDLIRGYNFWSKQFGQTGEQKHHDLAKKAALAHYASMISKISHHPGHPEYETAKQNAEAMRDSHMSALASIATHAPKRIEAPKKKLVDKIKGLFRE